METPVLKLIKLLLFFIYGRQKRTGSEASLSIDCVNFVKGVKEKEQPSTSKVVMSYGATTDSCHKPRR